MCHISCCWLLCPVVRMRVWVRFGSACKLCAVCCMPHVLTRTALCAACVCVPHFCAAAGCRSTPGCVVVPRVGSKGATDLCVSDHFNKLSKDGMNQFMYALALAEPSVVGGCDGACWMRQVGWWLVCWLAFPFTVWVWLVCLFVLLL
jgi:hypothetical protein